MVDEVCPYTFTIFTPSYNRAHTLRRVYESLKAQTFRDFEWLIVDDGSTDDTRVRVESWQREAKFPIRYLYQENQGKHIAHNRAVREARGELFLGLDSDDACVPQALERFKYHWGGIPRGDKALFCGVTSLCIDERGKIIGRPFPFEITDSNFSEIHYRFKVSGEKWPLYLTSVLGEYPFPEHTKGEFIPEGVIHSMVAKTYKMRFINEPLRVYYVNNRKDSDQLMKSISPAKFARGGSMWHRLVLNEDIGWFRYAPEQFALSAVHYSRFCFHRGVPVSVQFRQLGNDLARSLWLAFLPLGLAAYLRDRKWMLNSN